MSAVCASMLRFRLFDFPILVHWMFWVNMALLGGAIGADTPQEMQSLFGWVAAAFLSIVIHELGHAFAMRHFGDRQVGILLYAFGGLARGSRWLGRVEDIIVSAAGPAVQIAIGYTLKLLLSGWQTESVLLGSFVQDFIYISIFWALLNLLPIIPLDGGHICRAFLGSSRVRTALIISMVCAVGIGLLALRSGSLITPLFFGMMAFNNWKELQGQPQVPWMEGR
jgi:stage IV sporulation protein FB